VHLLLLLALAGKPWRPSNGQCLELARHVFALQLSDNRADPQEDPEEEQLRHMMSKADREKRVAKYEAELKANEKKRVEELRGDCVKTGWNDVLTPKSYACALKAPTGGAMGKCIGQ
jgi:hypothetical protein